jgi:hypothetical protein
MKTGIICWTLITTLLASGALVVSNDREIISTSLSNLTVGDGESAAGGENDRTNDGRLKITVGLACDLSLSDNLLENVPPGENGNVTLSVAIPENAELWSEDLITVIATSQSDNTISDNDVCVAYVTLSKANLLQNPSFENDVDNDQMPDNWIHIPEWPPAEIEFDWDSTIYHDGTHSVSIESTIMDVAMWRQVVPVLGDTMYTFAGWVRTDNIISGGGKLQLVFRDSNDNVISFFELGGHSGTIRWIYDNPHEVTVLSPSDAVKVEVNCFLRGIGKIWFDNLYFGLTPTGAITGTVTSGGNPVANAYVYVFGTSYAATTDADGRYTITNVPVASPRYIVIASKTGYLDSQQGDVDIVEGGTVTVDFDLIAGDNLGELIVRGCSLRKRENSPILDIPPNAVIDPDLYPESVKPYLKPGMGIESDDPSIIEIANRILSGIAPENRTNLLQVVHAVYLWFGENIDYDLMSRYPYDVTCGNWQTTHGGWGHSFSDWLYTAVEVAEEERAICIEYARLTSAILRALNIPARPAPYMGHPGTQFWVQLPTGEGHWANMDTSVGSSAYRRSGDEWYAFPAVSEDVIGFWSVDENAPIHVDWYTENKCLWRESYGGFRDYPDTPEGYENAVEGLEYFAQHGVIPSGPSAPSAPCYSLMSPGVIIDLTSVGAQRIFWFRFPLAMETQYVHTIDAIYWTNHPEWVTRTWIENVSNPPVPDTWRWFYVEFDLGRKVEFKLENLYKVSLDVDLWLENGSELVVKFCGYDNLTLGGENVFWSDNTPAHVVKFENVPHPLGEPVKIAKLVRRPPEYFITSFTVTQDHLFERIVDILGQWPDATPTERNALWNEIIDILGQWPDAPP